MKPNRLTTCLLAAAFLAFTLPAAAQYRVGSDGRTNDANNRLGSSGYNEGPPPADQTVTGNDIVNRNVTGGRAFRDIVGYRDPRAFTGPTAGGISDRFVRDSSGAPQPNQAPPDLTTPRPFYGDSRGVAPPPGYIPEGFSGGYVPAPTPTVQPQDWRLGTTLDVPIAELPRPGQLVLPGPVDTSSQQTVLTASPLFGVRQLNPAEANDRAFLFNYGNLRPETGAERLNLDELGIQRMQNELQQATPDQQPQGNLLTQGLPNRPLDSSMSSQALTAQVNAAPMGADLTTDQGQRQRLVIAPAQQSAQYAELRRRFEQYGAKGQLTDEQSARQYNALTQAQAAGQKKAEPLAQPPQLPPAPGKEFFASPKSPEETEPTTPRTPAYRGTLPPTPQTPAPTQTPSGTQMPPPTRAPTITPNPIRPEPLKVESLATGVRAKGLADLLTRAEELMREGKFTSALDHYDAAERVAPNNKLIMLGRGNAELGAGYYNRAQSDIYNAFLSDPALMAGQYDLKRFLGQERLAFIVRDLKTIAKTEPDQVRPLFLLAYIAYNSGNEHLVTSYLDKAEKLLKDPDPVIRMMREYWMLPDQSPPNK